MPGLSWAAGKAVGLLGRSPDGHWLEPLTTLSVVAGMTTHIRLRTQILLAALRRPVTLAKSTATLDVLSGGRLDLGVGVGWQRAEYEAAGLSFEKRGRLLDHSLEVCQTLWREQRASYSAPELSFDAIHQMPKPLRPDGVPIWISGSIRDTTVRRLVRFGHRWIPWGPDDRSMKDSLPRMKEAIAKAGSDPDALAGDRCPADACATPTARWISPAPWSACPRWWRPGRPISTALSARRRTRPRPRRSCAPLWWPSAARSGARRRGKSAVRRYGRTIKISDAVKLRAPRQRRPARR